jgi:hypothetical protein
LTTTQKTRLAALRDPVAVLCALENKHLMMDASEYLLASQRVSATLRTMGIVELIVVSRSMMPVLSQLADNLLIERGADHLAGDLHARTGARAATAQLLDRL